MPTSIVGGQYYSISQQGMALFEQGKITTGVGGVIVDLASAPIPAGTYTLEMQTIVGGMEIYLPRYVKFTIDGTSVIGGKNIHEGLDWWKRLETKFKNKLHLPNKIPDHAVASEAEAGSVHINLILHTGVGGVDIYRL